MSTASPASSDCASEFVRDQFVGTWSEEGSNGSTTLNADGTMTSSSGGKGTWEFTKWSATPSPARPGDENACVLWLKPKPVLNLVYGVLNATEQTIRLTYIGRGNTITWIKQKAD